MEIFLSDYGSVTGRTGGAAAVGLLFLVDYGQGRTVYQAFASYHAYLEFPVLLMLLFGRVRPGAAGEGLRASFGVPPGFGGPARMAAQAP